MGIEPPSQRHVSPLSCVTEWVSQYGTVCAPSDSWPLALVCLPVCLCVSLCVSFSVCVCLCVSFCMSAFAYVRVSSRVCVSFCVSACVFVCVSLCVSVCLSLCVCVCLSVCQCVFLCVFVCVSLCVSLCVSFCVCVSLSIVPCVWRHVKRTSRATAETEDRPDAGLRRGVVCHGLMLSMCPTPKAKHQRQPACYKTLHVPTICTPRAYTL